MPSLLEHLWKALCAAWRVLHRLWLEVTGTLFLGLAAIGALSALREWRQYEAGAPPWEFLLALAFVIMMGSFGIYSFFRARRLR